MVINILRGGNTHPVYSLTLNFRFNSDSKRPGVESDGGPRSDPVDDICASRGCVPKAD